jgi:hypothetical protein
MLGCVSLNTVVSRTLVVNLSIVSKSSPQVVEILQRGRGTAKRDIEEFLKGVSECWRAVPLFPGGDGSVPPISENVDEPGVGEDAVHKRHPQRIGARLFYEVTRGRCVVSFSEVEELRSNLTNSLGGGLGCRATVGGVVGKSEPPHVVNPIRDDRAVRTLRK